MPMYKGKGAGPGASSHRQDGKLENAGILILQIHHHYISERRWKVSSGLG